MPGVILRKCRLCDHVERHRVQDGLAGFVAATGAGDRTHRCDDKPGSPSGLEYAGRLGVLAVLGYEPDEAG